ncbi:MAG: hypothetical protein HS113_14475 [Verrucomicrobiales bacterium]|nr:hypothetical protein [Verrucomicrobiales bacterium]
MTLAYIRRSGHSPEDAQDLTQEFFALLIAKHCQPAVRSSLEGTTLLWRAPSTEEIRAAERDHDTQRGSTEVSG